MSSQIIRVYSAGLYLVSLSLSVASLSLQSPATGPRFWATEDMVVSAVCCVVLLIVSLTPSLPFLSVYRSRATGDR